MAVSLQPVAVAVCEGLGIDPTDVASVDIHLDGYTLPRVTVTRHLLDGDRLVDMVSRFVLIADPDHS